MGEGTAERGGESDDDEEKERYAHTIWRFNWGHVRLFLE